MLCEVTGHVGCRKPLLLCWVKLRTLSANRNTLFLAPVLVCGALYFVPVPPLAYGCSCGWMAAFWKQSFCLRDSMQDSTGSHFVNGFTTPLEVELVRLLARLSCYQSLHSRVLYLIFKVSLFLSRSYTLLTGFLRRMKGWIGIGN